MEKLRCGGIFYFIAPNTQINLIKRFSIMKKKDFKESESTLRQELIKAIAKELCDSEEAFGEINAVATENDYEDVAERIVSKFCILIAGGSLPSYRCRCKELNSVNRICQKCGGIVPIRL